jgi:hypothetical protein
MKEDTGGSIIKTVKQNLLAGRCNLAYCQLILIERSLNVGKRTKYIMKDIRHLVAKPKKVKMSDTLKRLELPILDHKYGYFCATLQEHLSIKEYAKFLDWMNGQTCALVEGKVVCFTEDVVRFLEMVRNGKETYWD